MAGPEAVGGQWDGDSAGQPGRGDAPEPGLSPSAHVRWGDERPGPNAGSDAAPAGYSPEPAGLEERLLQAEITDRPRLWQGLTEPQRRAVIDVGSPDIGNLDGIPVAVRDEINQGRLSSLIDDARKDLANLTEEWKTAQLSGQPSDDSRVAEAQRVYDGYKAVAEALNRRDSDRPQLYLISISETGAVIAQHNPDECRNKVIYTPGMQASLAKISVGIERGQAILDAAVPLDQGAGTSVIQNYNYPIPQNLSQASRADGALAGAGPLRELAAGLRATHATGTDAFTTALNYSYGTRLAGEAAKDGLDVDVVVSLASPGMGVKSAAELILAGGKRGDSSCVFAAAHPFDLFTKTPAWIHGANPARRSFGAAIIEVPGWTGPLLPLSEFLETVHVHSYFGGLVLEKLAHIVTGTQRAETP